MSPLVGRRHQHGAGRGRSLWSNLHPPSRSRQPRRSCRPRFFSPRGDCGISPVPGLGGAARLRISARLRSLSASLPGGRSGEGRRWDTAALPDESRLRSSAQSPRPTRDALYGYSMEEMRINACEGSGPHALTFCWEYPRAPVSASYGRIWLSKGPVLRTLLQIGASTSQASHFSMRERGSSSGREIHGSLWRAGRFQLARRRAMFRNQTRMTPFCNKPECRVVSQTMLESGTPGSGMQGPAELVGPPVTLFTVCGLRPGSVVDQLNVDQPSCQC